MLSLTHISIMSSLPQIKDITLTISPGEIFGLIGPKSSGKSALLKTINASLPQTLGKVHFQGKDVGALTEKELLNYRKKVALIQKEPFLLPDYTILENLLLPVKHQAKKNSGLEEQALGFLRLFNLQGLEKAYPGQLAGDMRYKVTIARALMAKPQVLLFEDIAALLSQHERQALFTILEKLNQQEGLSYVITTSDIDIMKQFCHKVAIIHEGRLLELADPYALISSPKHPLTVEFLSKHLAFDLPEEVRAHAFGTIVLIEYTGEGANEPVLYEVSQRFGVEYNILQGRIEYIRGKALGKMYVSFNSEPGLMPAVLEYLSENTHHVEVIQHG